MLHSFRQSFACLSIFFVATKCSISSLQDFEVGEKYNEVMSRQTYATHECRRNCTKGNSKRCRYKFVIEPYETLSKACLECPSNELDCFLPHCIHADGLRRSLVTVNRMMPGPMIDVCKDDILVVDVENNLISESTTIHWHGLHQLGTPFYDGVPMITQCPIPPHTSFRYTFQVKNTGSHWWHSHVGLQRADGAFGALIVRDLEPELSSYGPLVEYVMTIQDWEHKTGISSFTAFHHSIGDNKPVNILVNGKGRYTKVYRDDYTDPLNGSVPSIEPKANLMPYEIFNVEKGKRYRFRVIDSGFLNCPFELSIDNHSLTVVASDGHYIDPVDVDSLTLFAGERYEFILEPNQPVGNYWIRVRGKGDCDERFTKAYQGAILHYIGSNIGKYPNNLLDFETQREGLHLNSLDKETSDVKTLPITGTFATEPDSSVLEFETTDYKYYIHYDFYERSSPIYNNPSLYSNHKVSENTNKFFGLQMNHISMKTSSVPLLMSEEHLHEINFCNSTSLAERNVNCQESFCECVHTIQIPTNKTVEIVIIDEGYKYDVNHPFHLHGHDFRVVGMEQVNSNGTHIDQILFLDKHQRIDRKLSGSPIKDTVAVPDGGYTIIRFSTNNPGFWIFHCHLDFHMEIGMALVFKVGEFSDMESVPENFLKCSSFASELDSCHSACTKCKTHSLVLILVILALSLRLYYYFVTH